MYLHVVCDSLLLLVCNKSKTKERDAEVGRHTTSPLPDSEAEDKEEEKYHSVLVLIKSRPSGWPIRGTQSSTARYSSTSTSVLDRY